MVRWQLQRSTHKLVAVILLVELLNTVMPLDQLLIQVDLRFVQLKPVLEDRTQSLQHDLTLSSILKIKLVFAYVTLG